MSYFEYSNIVRGQKICVYLYVRICCPKQSNIICMESFSPPKTHSCDVLNGVGASLGMVVTLEIMV